MITAAHNGSDHAATVRRGGVSCSGRPRALPGALVDLCAGSRDAATRRLQVERNIEVWTSFLKLQAEAANARRFQLPYHSRRSTQHIRQQILAISPTPELLERLYRGYVRDIVTPGTEHTDEALLANCFPVYESRRDGTALTFRYMRYWIEKGAERAGLDFEASDIEAMDLLDSMMADESLHAQLHLRPGDALFIDNRDIAHNRTPYEDLPEKSRHLVRMWISGERAA